MKILFISGLYSESLKSVFLNNCIGTTLQDAPNSYQWAIVEGFKDNNADFFVFSYPWLPCFPFNYKSCHITPGDIHIGDMKIGKSFDYSPIIFLKDYSIKRSIRKNVRKWIQDNISVDDYFTVLTYTPEPYFIKPLISLKKEYPRMILATIVTDLVDDMKQFGSNRTFAKRIQCELLIKSTKRNYKYIDKYILLTKQIIEKIPESVRKNIVIEGIYNNRNQSKCEKLNPLSILYTGALENYAGIKILIDAFLKTKNKSYELIICGSGSLESYIREVIENDNRIVFKGNIPHDESIKLQKSAAILINPRQPNGKITKYSFPSKTMEYMTSGTPMIGYHLEGIPEEYYKYMFTPKDLSSESLCTLIEDLLSNQSNILVEIANEANHFIMNNKSAKIQVKKIIDFLSI